jgi:hypothetical protein
MLAETGFNCGKEKEMNISKILLAIFIFIVIGLPASAGEVKLGDQSVNISSYIQTRYSFDQARTDQFAIPRLRSDIWGDVNENFGYLIELDATASPSIIYGWIDVKPNKATKLRVGRFYYPFGLEYTTPPSRFDTINPTFCLWNLFGYSRDSGIQFSQNFQHFKYAVALVNGADNQSADDNEAKDLFGRFVFKKSKDFSAGLSFHVGQAGSTEAERQRIGAELDYKLERFGLKAEYIRARDNGVKKWGWYLQPSLWLSPAFQGLVRFEYWDPDTQSGGNLQTVTTFGVNAFFNAHAKLQVNFELKREETEVSNDAFLIQLQLKV